MRNKIQIIGSIIASLAMLAPGIASASLTISGTAVTSDVGLTLESAAGSDVVLGSATVAGAITIGGTSQVGTIGLGTGTAAQAINIGTGAGVVKTIAIGGTGANVIAIANTQTGGSAAIGAAMTTGTITIGGASQTGTINIGNSTDSNNLNVAAGGLADNKTGVYNFANSSNVGSGSTKNINIGGNQTGAGTVNLNIATNSMISGTMTVNIASAQMLGGTSTINMMATSGLGTSAINIGNAGLAANPTTITILGNINASGAVYLRIPASTTAPAGGDCDAAGEAGKIYIDTDAGGSSAGTMYFCNGSAWSAITDATP